MELLWYVVAFLFILIVVASFADYLSTLDNGLKKQVTGSENSGFGASYPSTALRYGLLFGSGLFIFAVLFKIATALREEGVEEEQT